eukprot:TRINITY_DN24638_c0_g1_i2.p1 TRINITY_DN24638_c0_g1~~TRINITY_DN24638_c0_g1_i2.p1  ORF type:complete len:284 (+),score=40.01 TRINITY_DN24638_c0_g1_i2:60-854(+)
MCIRDRYMGNCFFNRLSAQTKQEAMGMARPQTRRMDLSAISSSNIPVVPKTYLEGIFWCHFNIAVYFFTLVLQNLFLLFVQTLITYLIDIKASIGNGWTIGLLVTSVILETGFTASLLAKTLPLLIQIPLAFFGLLFKGILIVLLGDFFTVQGIRYFLIVTIIYYYATLGYLSNKNEKEFSNERYLRTIALVAVIIHLFAVYLFGIPNGIFIIWNVYSIIVTIMHMFYIRTLGMLRSRQDVVFNGIQSGLLFIGACYESIKSHI